MSSKIKVDTIENVAGSGNVSLGSGHNLVVPGDLTVDTSTLKVDSSNNRVGVGTASPTSDLHVSGGAGANLAIQSSAGSHWRLGDAVGSTNGYFVLRDHTNSANRITVNNQGYVGINTGSPTTALDVTRAAGANYVAHFQNTTNGSPYCLAIKDAPSGANGYPLLQVTNAAGSVNWFRVNSGNGYVVSTGIYSQSASDSANVVVDGSGNVYRATSALKYKKDVRDIESIDIDRFRPVRFKSANPRNDDEITKEYFGFIADEVHDDGITELVTYGVNSETEKKEVEGFNYDRMTVILTKVVQEQKATINALEARVKELESK